MSSLILKCPFCGKPADLDQFSADLADADWQVLCTDSACRGGIPLESGWKTRGDAINAWNKRVEE